ncbi:MAG: cyclase family protein [Pseudobdellovibrionaceae bacterium]
MKVYDLTPKIHPGLGVFPGDIGFRRNISMDFKKGQHLLLSSIETTLHLGAHADSSGHYHASGEGIEKRQLEAFFGPAQVIHVPTRQGQRISMKDLEAKKILVPRILFQTLSFPDPDQWNSDFMALSPEVIEYLHSQKCILVGIDTPSVDPEDSKALESHQALYRTQMAVLEGLILAKVPEGLYTLMALPLPIQGADASPVRALLFEDSKLFSSNEKFQFIPGL